MPIQILDGGFRSGPWPGLTARGALLILAHAVFLAGLAETWLPLSVAPMLSVTWLMRMPGVASAMCGAYLLPRSVLSLVLGVELPPLLLAPAMAFDLMVWLRRDDLRWRRRKHSRQAREMKVWRLALAAVTYELLLLVLAR